MKELILKEYQERYEDNTNIDRMAEAIEIIAYALNEDLSIMSDKRTNNYEDEETTTLFLTDSVSTKDIEESIGSIEINRNRIELLYFSPESENDLSIVTVSKENDRPYLDLHIMESNKDQNMIIDLYDNSLIINEEVIKLPENSTIEEKATIIKDIIKEFKTKNNIEANNPKKR